jgi:CSLREA domain-containing protein
MRTLARLLPLLVAQLLLLCAAPAHAAVFDVTKTADTFDGVCNPADCSLRDAIDASNDNGQGHDDVTLIAGTYNLVAGELPVITGDLDIEGTPPASGTLILQQGPARVFHIANTDDPVRFFDVTIHGGNVNGNGGGILSDALSGDVTIEDSFVQHNHATGSGSGGGGIYNAGGLLTIRRSTVRDNTATATGSAGSNGGGGIHEAGSAGLTIEDSTVSGNTATVSGANSGGGGIWSGPGATLTNSTLSGNAVRTSGLASGGGGALFATDGAALTHLTVAGNTSALSGGGLFNAGAPGDLRNTIVAGNSAGAGSNCSGAFSSSGNNLESADTCGLRDGVGDDPEDLVGTDPKLEPLADNGGPTQTRAIPKDSAAVDAADPSFCVGSAQQDQRGAGRTSNGCDIGAFEFDGLTVAEIPNCSPTGQIPLTMTAAPGEGVDSFHYRIDGGPEQIVGTSGGSQASTTLDIPEGRRQLEYWGQFSNGEQLDHNQPGVLVDKTKPQVDIQSEQRRSIYVITRRATVDVNAQDNLSGLVADPSADGERIGTRSRGRKLVTKTATDLCGHQSTDALAYTVLGPTLGVRAVLEPLGGRARIRLPGRGSASAAQKGRGFVALTQPREIPVGSLLDTRRGQVRLTSSRSRRATAIQDGRFLGGIFQVVQSRRRAARGLTDLRLKGASFRSCRAGGGGARASLSRRAIRRLRANARGRFRTRGRFSAATVRGTAWVTTDRCDGTLTRVTRGRVAVRDFRRRRTIVLRRGKSYLARAPGGARP